MSYLRRVNVHGVPNSVDPTQYYVPGIAAEAVSTADWYGSDGIFWLRPYDLSKMGSKGASAITALGGRFFWVSGPDHPATGANWTDGQDFRWGVSNDPHSPPDTLNNLLFPASGVGINKITDPTNTAVYTAYHAPNVVFNPEDTGNEFHCFFEGSDTSAGPGYTVNGSISSGTPTVVTGIADTSNLVGGGPGVGATAAGAGLSGAYVVSVDSSSQITLSSAATTFGAVTLTITNPMIQHRAALARSPDLINWTFYGPSHLNWFYGDWSSYVHVERVSAGNWWSYGYSYRSGTRTHGPPGDPNIVYLGNNEFNYGVFTSTDGINFNRPDPPQTPPSFIIGTRFFGFNNWDSYVDGGGQKWIALPELANNVTISIASPAVIYKTAHGHSVGDSVSFNTSGNLFTCTMNGTAVVTNLSPQWTGGDATTLLDVGMVVDSGYPYTLASKGITPGTHIQSVDSATQVTLSQPTTLSGTQNILFLSMPGSIQAFTTYYVQSVIDADHFTIAATAGGAAISTVGKHQYGQPHTLGDEGYITLCAVDSNFNILASPSPQRISDPGVYGGPWPGPAALQALNSILVDGVLTMYAVRGFFQSSHVFGLVDGVPIQKGGGLFEELMDIHSYIVDPTAAATTFPRGVQLTAANGVMSGTLDDALPQNTYRLYRGTTSASQSTLIGNFTGTSFSDTPGGTGIYYYKVVTISSAAEQQSVVVPVYVSSSSAFVNKHMLRVLNDGGDPTTIDKTFLDNVNSLLNFVGLHNSLENWANPRFGVKRSGGVVTKTYDLGTTRLPKYNDLWFATGANANQASTTSYNSAGFGGTAITWANANRNSYGVFGGLMDANGHWGRLNHIRRKYECSIFARYSKPSGSVDTGLLSVGEFGTLALTHLAAGQASFSLYDGLVSKTATSNFSGSATAPHVITGTFGHTGNLIAYADGVAGSPVTGLRVNSDLSVQTVLRGDTSFTGYVYTVGTTGSKFSAGATPVYVMDDAVAPAEMSDLVFFSQELTPAQVTTVTNFLVTGVVPGKNIVTDYGASPDGQIVTTNVTIGAGSTSLAVSTAIFVAGDVGKIIAVGGAGTVGEIESGVAGPLFTKIASFTDSQHVVLQDAAVTAVSGASESVEWGTDCSPPFMAFHADFQGQSGVILNVPAGRYCFNSNPYPNAPFYGIPDLTVNGTGNPVFSDMMGTGGIILGGAVGTVHFQSQACPRTNAANAGDTVIVLKDATQASKFTVPCHAKMTGFDTQGYGDPPNHQFYELVYITAISGVNVTIQSPLKNSYRDTWPQWSTPATGSTDDYGGPATLYPMWTGWDCTHSYNGFTLISTPTLANVHCRTLSVSNCTFPAFAINISTVENLTMTGCTVGLSWEMDKLIGSVTLNNCNLHGISCQNPSPDVLTINGGTVGNVAGTPKKLVASGVNFTGSLWFGPDYGAATEVDLTNCTFQPGWFGLVGNRETSLPSTYSLTSGVFKREKNGSPTFWAVPGHWCVWSGRSDGDISTFQVNDVHEDGPLTTANLYIATSWPDGFPPLSLGGTSFASTIGARSHPAVTATFTNCTGDDVAVAFSNAPPGSPLCSYWKKTYSDNGNNETVIPVFGTMVSIKVNVTQAYGGIGALLLTLNANVTNPDGTITSWTPSIDMTRTGQRTIMTASASGSVGADNLQPPSAPVWLMSQYNQPVYSKDISAEPSSHWPQYTLEIIANQGIGGSSAPPSGAVIGAAPFSLRLNG